MTRWMNKWLRIERPSSINQSRWRCVYLNDCHNRNRKMHANAMCPVNKQTNKSYNSNLISNQISIWLFISIYLNTRKCIPITMITSWMDQNNDDLETQLRTDLSAHPYEKTESTVSCIPEDAESLHIRKCKQNASLTVCIIQFCCKLSQ